jgi:PAS domain S-box-containing protein
MGQLHPAFETIQSRPALSQPLIKLNSRIAIVRAAALTTVLCYLAAELGGALVLRPQMLWPLWPGCALLVALLLLTPRKAWPILIAAGFAGFMLNDLLAFGLSIRESSTLIVADTIEILVAAVGISLSGDVVRLNSISSFAKYFLVTVILASTSAAFVSATAFRGSYWLFWGVGVLTEGLALLTVTPAILGVVRAVISRRYQSRAYYLEATAIMVTLFVLGYITFISTSVGHPELLYSLVPFLLWSALRLGITGISISIIVVAFLSVWGAVHGHGPFLRRGTISDVMSLQLFLLFAATPFMFLAALVEERKLAEQSLRESEEKFRSVFRDAGVGMVMVSPEGTILAANRSFCDCLGYTEEELLAHTVQSVTVPKDWPALSKRLRAVLREGRGLQRFEIRCLHKTGRIVYTESSATLIRSSEGSPQYFVGEVLDITKHKEAEEVLSGIRQKLIEAQDQERTRIARELHDDIGQRLALFVVELDQIRQNDPALLSDVLSRVSELQKQATELATDVQTMSHTLHSSKIEILGVVAAMRAACDEFGQHHKMEIDFQSRDLHAPLPSEISLGLFRVLQEALQNAGKHSGVKHVAVQLRGTTNEIHLIVQDSGKGFDLNAAMKGRGLGLTNMQERVRVLNGTIIIQSKPMGGTAIHVRIPLTWENSFQRATG